jgi:predicted phage tail protein
MKDKLFTSTNSKKGVLLEVGNNEVKISLWKKETPTSVIVDMETALEINNFLITELKDHGVDESRNQWWAQYIKDFTAKSDKAERDEPYDPKILE